MRLTIDGVTIEWDHLAGAGKMIGEALHVCRCVLQESLDHHGKLPADRARHALRMIERAENEGK